MGAEPEWTERVDKRGLDPLGMQNAGVAHYQSLVPGISNVTLRIRYFGFYCWVSDAYAREKGSTDFAEWRSWVRLHRAYQLARPRTPSPLSPLLSIVFVVADRSKVRCRSALQFAS